MASFSFYKPHSASAASTIPDGEYSVYYRYLKDGTINTSTANSYLYVENSGKLIVQDGQLTFQHEVDSTYYGWIPYLGVRNPDASKAVIDPSTNEVEGISGYTEFETKAASNGNYIVSYRIEDINEKPDILIHIVIEDAPEFPAGFIYDNWYNMQLEIDTSDLPISDDEEDEDLEGDDSESGEDVTITIEMLSDLVSVTSAVYGSATEGTDYGDYPVGSKAQLYESIQTADTVLQMSDPSPELIETVYNSLNAAFEEFKSLLISADKESLSELVQEMEAFLDTMKEVGETEGMLGHTYVPITPGEYTSGKKNELSYVITNAQEVLDDERATQEEVDTAVSYNTNRFNDIKENYYVASDPIPIYILDSREAAYEQSEYASDFEDTAVFLTLKYMDGLLNDTYANLTFVNVPDVSNVVQSIPNFMGDFTTEGLDYSNDMYKAQLVTGSSDDTNKVYQVDVKKMMVTDAWVGLSYVRYETNGETREVYISYNAEQLEALNQDLEDAQQFLAASSPRVGAEDLYEVAKEQLERAIETAEETVANLASTRPEITVSSQALQTALDTYKEYAAYEINFSVADGTEDSFSTVSDYFLNPAVMTTVEGMNYADLTLQNSSLVQSLQVANEGEFAEAEEVENDPTTDTRVVRVKLDQVSELVDAKLTVVEEGIEQTYPIRLNFNGVDNDELNQAVKEAWTLLAESEVGESPGQYSQEDYDALKQAVDEAALEAINTEGTQEETEAAYSELQEAIATFKASEIEDEDDDDDKDSDSESGGSVSSEDGNDTSEENEEDSSGSTEDSTEDSTDNDMNDSDDLTEEVNDSNNGLNDMLGHWAKAVVDQATMLGIVSGYPDGTFRPNDEVSRAEFSVMLGRGLNLDTFDADAFDFVDDEQIPEWASSYIAQAVHKGIISGYADGTFRPNQAMNRAEAVSILIRALNLPVVQDASVPFLDADQIQEWAKPYVAAAYEIGLVSGRDEQRFAPQEKVTRAEAVTMLIRMLDYMSTIQ